MQLAAMRPHRYSFSKLLRVVEMSTYLLFHECMLKFYKYLPTIYLYEETDKNNCATDKYLMEKLLTERFWNQQIS